MSQGNSTSAFKTDGTLWFWGLQYNGAFGQNGPSIHRSSPVQCGSGWDHTATFNTNFVKKTDGTWWTWGNGGSGNLGLNTSIKYSSPTQLPGTWAQIDQQGRTGLGVKTDGTLWTWGQNTENGLLGLNQSPDFRISSPTQIGTGTDWGSDAGGLQGGHYLGFAAAIKTDGSLYMWGKNVNGNLGVNQAPAQLASLSSPTQVPGIYTEIQNTDMEKYGAWSMRGV
jgi:alpha-tubulin suppressor-like RCC1 family protein